MSFNTATSGAPQKIDSLINVDKLKPLFEKQHKATGLTIALADSEENILLGFGWQQICLTFHRKNVQSLINCRESDAYIKNHLQKTDYVSYKCKNGLFDVAVPIKFKGKHLGTLFFGQFFYDDELPDRDYFVQQAKKFGFDQDEYLAALDKVPVYSRQKINDIMEYYKQLVGLMLENGNTNYLLKKELEQRKSAENELKGYKRNLENVVKERTSELEMINLQLEEQIKERAAIEEELRTTNEQLIEEIAHRRKIEEKLQFEIGENQTIEEELRTTNENLAEEIQVRKKVEEQLKEHSFQLNERVKELNCLHKLEELGNQDQDIEDYFREALKLIPASWRDPEHTCCRISFEGKKYFSDGYNETKWNLRTGFSLNGSSGLIEVFYTNGSREYPFLKEEEQLLKSIAAKMQAYIFNRKAEQKLKQSEEITRTLVHASNNLAELLDRSGSILAINKSNANRFGMRVEEMLGKNIFELLPAEISHKKKEALQRAIQLGKNTSFEYEWEGRFYESHINPIYATGSNYVERFAVYSIDLTERKKTEEQLRNERLFLEHTMNSLPDLFYQLDAEGHYVNWNKKLEEVSGYSAEELKTLDPMMTIQEQDRAKVAKNIREVFLKGSAGVEAVVVDKNGKKTPYSFSGKLVYHDNKPYLLGMGIDISRLVEINEKLKQSEEQHRMIFEAVSDAIIIADKKGKIVEVNPEACKLYGYEYEEMTGMSSLELITEDYHKNHRQFSESLAETGSYHGETIDRRKDGSTFYTNVKGTRVSFKGEEYFLAAIRDVTEKKLAERQLKRNEREFRTLIEATSQIVWWAEPDGNVTERQLSWEKFTGQDFDSYKGFGWAGCFHPEDMQITIEQWQKALQTKEKFEIIHRLKNYKGEYRIMQARAVPVIENDGSVYVWIGTHTDITEIKERESTLHKTMKDLERSNQELEQFAYVASHDLQEPLRMVSSFLQLLKRRYESKLDETANSYIGFAVDGASRMQQLIRDLLTFSRVGTRGKEFEATDIEKVLKTVISNLRLSIEESSAMIHFDKMPEVNVDASQITQLFQNLIGNSIKFRGEKVPEILISAQRLDDYYEFTVKDNGIGIASEYSDRIFEVFQRLHTREEYDGTGIGLAVCKKIVERHGGSIRMESEEGKGSSFIFSLPANDKI